MDMLSQLRVAVEGFPTDSARCSWIIQELFNRNEKQFRSACGELLRDFEESSGFSFLLSLMNERQMLMPCLAQLAEDGHTSLRVVAQAAHRANPLLHLQLAEQLLKAGAGATPRQEQELLRYLDIIESITSRFKMFPLVKKLMSCSNPRVCSRATLLIGRMLESTNWIVERLGHEDHRVRANAIEALWDIALPGTEEIYRKVLDDPHGRVVANALVGLYLRGDVGALSRIQELSKDEKAERRASAAWAMGQLRDRRFLPILRTLWHDNSALVRANALRAIGKIRKTVAQAKESLQIEVLGAARGEVQFAAWSRDPEKILTIAPLNVNLELDGVPVLDYKLTHIVSSLSVAVAVLVPNAPALLLPHLADVERPFATRRPSDVWTLLPYTPDAAVEPPEVVHDWQPAWFSGRRTATSPTTSVVSIHTEPARVRQFVEGSAPCAPPPPGLYRQAAYCCEQLRLRRAARHLVLFIPDRSINPGTEEERKALLDAAEQARVTIHVIAREFLGGAAPDYLEMTDATEGHMLPHTCAAPLEALARALFHRFVLKFSPEAPADAAHLRLSIDAAGGWAGQAEVPKTMRMAETADT